MSEKGAAQNIMPVQGNTSHTDNNLENGHSVDFAEQTARVQSLGSVRLRSEKTGEIILVPTPTNDPNDPLVTSSSKRGVDVRIGHVRSSMPLPFWCALPSFFAIFLLLDRLLLSSRLHRLSSRWKRTPT
jgi:hypothetical protein